MKKKSKELIKEYGVFMQIRSRRTKTAKGMSFTSERRARILGKSIFYSIMSTGNKCSKVARTLSVYGTTDILAKRRFKKTKNRII